jgi:TRAP transporter TAXI family solute receptor
MAQVERAQEAKPDANDPYAQQRQAVNSNVVYIASGAPTSSYARIAEDIQIVLEDEQAKEMRVLPTMSRGGGQNFVDLLLLTGIDMALVEQDHPKYFRDKEPRLYGKATQKVRYITKLYNSEFHIVAKKDVSNISMLKGKKVNFFKKLSSTAICAENVFGILGLDVEPTYYDDNTALQKLKEGEIAAIARLGGAPLPTFAGIKAEDGLHFVPLEEQSDKYTELLQVYAPNFLKSDLYPGMIPQGQTVLGIANATVLMTYAWPENSERYKRIARFVDRFFTRFDQFSQGPRHPKWKEVNLAAQLPGWQRFTAAQQWLDRNANVAASESAKMKTEFSRLMEDYAKTSRMNPAQRDALIKEFSIWFSQQSRK